VRAWGSNCECEGLGTNNSNPEQRERFHPIMMNPTELLYLLFVLLRIALSEIDGITGFVIIIPGSEAEEFEFVR